MNIPIFFTIDENFAKYLSVAIISLIDNASKDYSYTINIIHEDLSEDTINKLKSLEKKNFEIKFYKMDTILLEGITDCLSNRLRADYFTLTIYFRIFIPYLFKEYDKGIYLDSDIVVSGDISTLYNIDLEGNLLGAVNDYSIKDNEILTGYVESAVGVSPSKYFNSGVLLMDMKGLRDVLLHEKFLHLLNTYHFDAIAPDQDYLNAMLKNKVKLLDHKFDAMPLSTGELVTEPVIIHYNLFFKPWHYEGVSYEDEFWRYAEISPFSPEIEGEFKNYDGKNSDKEHMDLMCKRADEITKSVITFKAKSREVSI